VEPYGEVVWNGTRDAERQRSQQRQPSELEAQHVRREALCGKRRSHATVDDPQAARIREQWHRENQPISTSGLPRGEPVKT